MIKFKEFLAALNTPGGYILILFILFNEGILFYHFIDSTGGGQIINLSFGALSGYLTAKEMDRRKLQLPIPPNEEMRATDPDISK